MILINRSLSGLGDSFDLNACYENCNYVAAKEGGRTETYYRCLSRCQELNRMTEQERREIQTEELLSTDIGPVQMAPITKTVTGKPKGTISSVLKRIITTKAISVPVQEEEIQEEIPSTDMEDIISQQDTEQYVLGIPMSKIKQYAPYVLIGGGALTLLYLGLRKKKQQ